MKQPLTVLIVDDNVRMRAVIRVILRDVASAILECSDGAAGVVVYEHARPDWVLMDISMPIMDGIAATRRICAVDPSARVLMVTDYSDIELLRAAAAAGAVGYVTKDDLSRLPGLLV